MLPRWGWFALVAVAVSFGMRALASWSRRRGETALREARVAVGLPGEPARASRRTHDETGEAGETDGTGEA